MNRFDRCNCECHNDRFNVKHIVPCCFTCQICHVRFKTHNFDQHKKECNARLETTLEEFKKKHGIT